MMNINKISILFTSLALALALVVTGAPTAEACGSYGPPTDEEMVVRLANFQHHSAWKLERGVFVVDSVDVNAGRLAVVKGRTRIDGKLMHSSTYALYKIEGRWRVATSPTATLVIAGLQHALDADVKATFDEPHDAFELRIANL